MLKQKEKPVCARGKQQLAGLKIGKAPQTLIKEIPPTPDFDEGNKGLRKAFSKEL